MHWKGWSITTDWSSCAQEWHRHAAIHSNTLSSNVHLYSPRCEVGVIHQKGSGIPFCAQSALTAVPLKLEMETALMGCSVGPISEDSSPARVGKGKGSPVPYCPAATLQVHLVELSEVALLLSSLRVPAQSRAHLNLIASESGKLETFLFFPPQLTW